MFSVEIEDDSPRANAIGKRSVLAFSGRARAALLAAVQRERSSHRYTNRTYSAETQTKLTTAKADDDGIDVAATMNVEYASHLNDRGWSAFDALVRRALDQIDADARKLG